MRNKIGALMTIKKGIFILSGIKRAVKGADTPSDKLPLLYLACAKCSLILYISLYPGGFFTMITGKSFKSSPAYIYLIALPLLISCELLIECRPSEKPPIPPESPVCPSLAATANASHPTPICFNTSCIMGALRPQRSDN
jgi:hypothetical protein